MDNGIKIGEHIKNHVVQAESLSNTQHVREPQIMSITSGIEDMFGKLFPSGKFMPSRSSVPLVLSYKKCLPRMSRVPTTFLRTRTSIPSAAALFDATPWRPRVTHLKGHRITLTQHADRDYTQRTRTDTTHAWYLHVFYFLDYF